MTDHMTHFVFVYGTLKEGFANFRINGGRRIPGSFETVERLPLYVIGSIHVPWLVDQPGQGEYVLGQVFEVDDRVLREMDRLEQVDEDGWYTRSTIQVRDAAAPADNALTAFVYFGDSERLSTEPIHSGPLREFTAEQNAEYRESR